MIRLTWRQFRTQAAVVFGALVIVAIVVGITGRHLRHLYDTTVAPCKAACGPVIVAFRDAYRLLQTGLPVLLLVAPALIGIFWGAPLIARELETGTFRLAWTQSVTRGRWLAAKLGFVGLSSMAVAALLSLMVTWWFSPIDRLNANRFLPGVFDGRGIVAIGYATFAFALGAATGVLIRRTLPAMATTLVAYIGVRLAMTTWIRPRLIAPAHIDLALRSSSGLGFTPGPSGITFVADRVTIPNALVVSSRIVDDAGRAPTAQSLHEFLVRVCPSIVSPPSPAAGGHVPVGSGAADAAFHSCIAQLSAAFHLAVTYQPASRYWPFQWYETAIFVGLALVLTGCCFWWVRHRVS